MTRCPYCRSSLDHLPIECPKCGRAVGLEDITGPAALKARKAKRDVITGAVAVLVVVGVAVGLLVVLPRLHPPKPAQGTAAPVVTVAGQGFRLTMLPGWTFASPATNDLITTYALHPVGSPLTDTVATIPIPSDQSLPKVIALSKEDIVTVALTVNGTTGSTPVVTEQGHVVEFAGESCARLGLKVSNGDSRSITCRRGGVIYVIAVSGSATAADLLSALDTIAGGWTWI